MPRGKLFAVMAVIFTVLLTAGIATAHGRLSARTTPTRAVATVNHFKVLHAARAASIKTAPKAASMSLDTPAPTSAPCVESDDDSSMSGSESDDSSTESSCDDQNEQNHEGMGSTEPDDSSNGSSSSGDH